MFLRQPLRFYNLSEIFIKTLRKYSSNQEKLLEITKNCDQFSKIKITSTIDVLIKPYDLFQCLDGTLIRGTILGPKSYPHFDINVVNENINVTSILDNSINDDYTCILEVPVKSDIDVTSWKNVQIFDMHSGKIQIITENDIKTRNLRSVELLLHSIKGGNIECQGLLLAKSTNIKTIKKGNIILDKVQGNSLSCQSFDGNIRINSCYVDDSKFRTENGDLQLQNMHKNIKVQSMGKGKLEMVGIHGNIQMETNQSQINLQIEELFGINSIKSNGEKQTTIINISDRIEDNCCIEIHSKKILLEDSIQHLCKYLENNYERFNYNNIQNNSNNNRSKLLISTEGDLKLGRMSWADNIRAKMMYSHSKNNNLIKDS